MPDPIIDPATIMVESSNPKDRTNPDFESSISALPASIAFNLIYLLRRRGDWFELSELNRFFFVWA